jgi:uncharacterized membrane protein YidH (DUF202 family)
MELGLLTLSVAVTGLLHWRQRERLTRRQDQRRRLGLAG